MTDVETLTRFLEAWKLEDWASMANSTQLTWRSKHQDPAGWLEGIYGLKRLHSFVIDSLTSISSCASRIQIQVEYEPKKVKGFGKQSQVSRTISAMVICESGPYAPTPEGQWGVNPISTLR